MQSEETRCGGDVDSKTGDLTPQQATVWNVMRSWQREIERRDHDPRAAPKGMLAWHQVGSGKTCLMAAVILAFTRARSPSHPKSQTRPIFIVTSSENVKNLEQKDKRGRDRIRACMEDMMPQLLAQADLPTRKPYELVSFTTAANRLGLGSYSVKTEFKTRFREGVILMDEVQAIFEPLPQFSKQARGLRSFLKKLEKATILMLTATPGKSPTELLELMSTLKRPGEPSFSPSEILGPDGAVRERVFAERARGIVSFYDNSGNVADFPTLKHRVIVSPMRPKQAKIYREKEAIDTKAGNFSETAWNSLKNKDEYVRRSRAYANSMHPSSRGFAAAMKQLDSMADYSIKLAVLVHLLQTEAVGSKSYVYSAFGQQGAIQIGQALEAMGWTDVTQNPAADPLPGQDGKRFISTARWSSRATAAQRRAQSVSIAEFNREDNDFGDRIALIVANKRYNEGLNLQSVRRVIEFEPQTSVTKEQQMIGRARRFCSHARLSPEQRTVEVIHLFASFAPEGNEQLLRRAEQLKSQISELRNEAGSLVGGRIARPAVDPAADLFRSAQAELAATRDLLQQAVLREQLPFLSPSAAKTPRSQDKIRALASEAAQAARELEHIREKTSVLSRTADEFIFDMARRKYEPVRTLLTLLRNSAVDCRVFERFHSELGIGVDCIDA